MPATESQKKIAEIMGSLNLEEMAQSYVDKISAEICDHAELIAFAQMEERGETDSESPTALKIYNAAEAMIIAAVLRHMENINRRI
jgi:hypothetical protein